jgi:hypothetical protein
MRLDGAVAGSVLGSGGDYSQGGSVAGSQRVNLGQPREEGASTLADRTLDLLRRDVSVLLAGVLGLGLLPRLVGAAAVARRRPLVSLGVGVLGFIGVIVALGLLLLVTVLVAILLGLLGLGSLTGVTVFGGLLVGAAIPVAGGWLEALLVLLGLGALLLTARRPGHRVAEPTAVSPAGGAPGR